jgi:2-polyprenyl-3-methyl-5-hydroxy-6-metoxy-1,4-benzoquinol methylase
MTDLTKREEWARFYRAKTRFSGVNQWVNRNLIERELYDEMASVLDDSDSHSLIEMGCANSDWLPYFASKYNYPVAGIDYLQSGCRLAERKLEAEGHGGARIFCGDFRQLHDTAGRGYDVLVSFGVIEHFDEPGALLGEFAGYLRNGGLMITVCPNTAGHAMRLQKNIDRAVYDGHLRFDLDALVRYHEEGGMSVERARYIGFMSLNNLDFSGYKRLGIPLKMLVKLLNGPLVLGLYGLRRLGVPPGNPLLSGSMFVAARKT